MTLKVTELDFFQIKENLKAHLKSIQSTEGKFTDYDFEGSGMNVLLDLLAYNTHYNAINANMAINEVFLDTSERRGNIVSHAKLLGYIPRSMSASYAIANIDVTGVSSASSLYTLNRGTKFTTIINNKQYPFTVLESVSTTKNNGAFNFTNIQLHQGEIKSFNYVVDSFDTTQYYAIPDLNVDKDTIIVKVKQNESATAYDVFTLVKNFTTLSSSSNAFFLQEGIDGKYEIYFGDGITGRKLDGGNVLTIEWLSTEGPTGNGANVFTLADSVDGDFAITTLNKSAGGADREDNNSIKFNAPLSYVAQNRVVTPDDYKAAILENYNNVESISVWGGELNDPPQYGKAYICIKPQTGDVLEASEKTKIKDTILKPRNIVSITPEIVDPEYTYLKLQVFFKYNPNLTDKTSGELQSIVRGIINDYNNTELKKFDGVFRLSKLTRLIDTCEPSILNSTIRVYMQKRFVPALSASKRYQLNYSSAIYTAKLNENIIQSTSFTYGGVTQYLQDRIGVNTHSDVGGTNNLEMYKIVNNTKYVTNTDVGYIDAENGILVLTAFSPSAFDNSYITINALPNSNDVAPKRNQLIQINMDEIDIAAEVDTIATGGTPAGIGYSTTTKDQLS